MTDCWKENPDDRPTFATLRDMMAKMERNRRVCAIYVNGKLIKRLDTLTAGPGVVHFYLLKEQFKRISFGSLNYTFFCSFTLFYSDSFNFKFTFSFLKKHDSNVAFVPHLIAFFFIDVRQLEGV